MRPDLLQRNFRSRRWLKPEVPNKYFLLTDFSFQLYNAYNDKYLHGIKHNYITFPLSTAILFDYIIIVFLISYSYIFIHKTNVLHLHCFQVCSTLVITNRKADALTQIVCKWWFPLYVSLLSAPHLKKQIAPFMS